MYEKYNSLLKKGGLLSKPYKELFKKKGLKIQELLNLNSNSITWFF